MEQDDAEEEVVSRTIWQNVGLLSKAVHFNDKRELFLMVHAVLILSASIYLALIFTGKFGNPIKKWKIFLGLSSPEDLSWQETLGTTASVFSLQGRRPNMEDRFAMVKIPYPAEIAQGKFVKVYLVLDGHGGDFSAAYVKRRLIDGIVKKIKVLQCLQVYAGSKNLDRCVMEIHRTGFQPKSGLLKFLGLTGPEEFKSIVMGKKYNPKITSNVVSSASRVKILEDDVPKMKSNKVEEKSLVGNETFIHSDLLSPYSNIPKKGSSDNFRKRDPSRIPAPVSEEKDITDYLVSKNGTMNFVIDYDKLIRDEIAAVDKDLLIRAKQAMHVGGTTLLLAIHDNHLNNLWVANVGDSRGVLSSGDEVVPLSYDHKPSQIKEKKRIEEAGGFVAMNGVWRVQGILAISRALGDFPLKKFITSEPDVLSFDLLKVKAEFAILASDGLWDTHSNEEAVAFAKSLMKESEISSAAEALTMDSYRRGSTDNITILIFKF